MLMYDHPGIPAFLPNLGLTSGNRIHLPTLVLIGIVECESRYCGVIADQSHGRILTRNKAIDTQFVKQLPFKPPPVRSLRTARHVVHDGVNGAELHRGVVVDQVFHLFRVGHVCLGESNVQVKYKLRIRRLHLGKSFESLCLILKSDV